MVKRTTIHVSSRTKMNHPKKWRVRIITKDKKGNEKKTTNTTYTILTTKLPLQESWLQYCPREAVVFGCLPCSKIAQGEALFIVVKVVLVVFPTQQAVSKQHDTTLESLHLRIKKLYSYE